MMESGTLSYSCCVSLSMSRSDPSSTALIWDRLPPNVVKRCRLDSIAWRDMLDLLYHDS